MIAREVNVFLTKAALVDPRMKRVDRVEQADMASQWADLLDDVPLEAALGALRTHYRSSSDPITPAVVLELAGVEEAPRVPDITAEYVEETKRLALAAAGVTEDEWRAHATDRVWLEARFAQELEAGR